MHLTVKDAAKLLGVSEKSIYRWLTAEAIPYTKVGEQYRFSRPELIDWAISSGKRVNPQAAREDDTPDVAVRPVSEILRQGGIHYRISGDTPIEVLKEVVATLRLPSGVSEAYLFEALAAREALASTGIGDAIALPHTRHPLIQLNEPFLSLAFLAHPVDWSSVDGYPVRLLFIICCPTTRSHLLVLSKLNFLLRNPAVQDVLKREGYRDEILKAFSLAERQ